MSLKIFFLQDSEVMTDSRAQIKMYCRQLKAFFVGMKGMLELFPPL